jgi:hypothetical protein
LHTTTTRSFLTPSLITPERIARDPAEAFATSPAWASIVYLQEDAADLPPADQTAVVLVKTSKSPQPFFCSLPQLAFLYEATRFGHSIVVNANSQNPPRIYPKFMPEDVPEDTFPISRVWMAAGVRQAVKRGDDPRDERVEELSMSGAGKPNKTARLSVMQHVERLARDRAPADFNVEAYLNNLGRLLAMVDADRIAPGNTTDEPNAVSPDQALSAEIRRCADSDGSLGEITADRLARNIARAVSELVAGSLDEALLIHNSPANMAEFLCGIDPQIGAAFIRTNGLWK